jgi:hypothetical protein
MAMKNLAILAISFLLAACATFDNNEYARLVDMRYELREDRCRDEDDARRMVRSVKTHTEWLSIYSQHLPNNSNTVKMLSVYQAGVKEFNDAYDRANPSLIYCRIRVKNLHDQLDIMLATTARRPR